MEGIRSYIIEGIDRLGKSTLISGLKNTLGHFEVIHYQKPEVLHFYKSGYTIDSLAKLQYQRSAFNSMFYMLESKARLILDRAHLGEMVYAPIYRGYSGDYVIEFEKEHRAHEMNHVRLILLVENFEVSKHFIDDGESFDPGKRKEEQNMFLRAFHASTFKDKRIICVTDPDNGHFKTKQQILKEATQ